MNQNAYEIHTVWGGAGGKAWFGGLASSGLAGYRAWGNASVKHFYPLIGCDVAIIPRATDKLLGVIARRDLFYFRSHFERNLSKAGRNDLVGPISRIDSYLMIIKAGSSQNQ